MISRVSFASSYDILTNEMLSKQSEVRNLQEAISKGKALLRPSDDPAAWVQSMNLKSAQKEMEQWRRNIEFGTSWAKTTEGTLSHLNDLLTRSREIAIKAIKATSPEEREALKNELSQIKDEIDQLVETKYRDRELFHDPPDDPVKIRIGKNKTMEVSVGREEVFGTAGDTISDHVQALHDAIDSNDVNAISTSMGDVESDQQRVLSALTKVGAIMNRLEARENAISSISINYEERIGEMEKADIAKLATEYQLKKTALQAIYHTTASVSELSLLRYV